jgi:hypothetical protein
MLENGLTLTQNRVGTVTVCRILNQPFDWIHLYIWIESARKWMFESNRVGGKCFI